MTTESEVEALTDFSWASYARAEKPLCENGGGRSVALGRQIKSSAPSKSDSWFLDDPPDPERHRHVCFEVDKPRRRSGRLEAAGAPIRAANQRILDRDRLFVRDPAGNLVELIEVPLMGRRDRALTGRGGAL